MKKKNVKFSVIVYCTYNNQTFGGEVAVFRKEKDALIYVKHLKTFSDIELLGFTVSSVDKVVVEVQKEKGYFDEDYFVTTEEPEIVYSEEIPKGE